MRRALAAWDRFWFAPVSTATLGVVRIAFATVLLAWAVALAPDVLSFLGSEGILPRAPDYATAGQSGSWSLLGSNPTDAAVVVFYAVFVVAVICLLVGFHTRLAALAVFCGLVSFTRRNPFVLNSGDLLLRVTAFYLLLAPAGSALSLDRWRRARREGADFWDFPRRAMWPVRLLQVQLSVLYLSTLWAKAGGTTWADGSAVSYALRVGFLNRLPVPDVVSDSLLLSNLLSYATLGTELALAVLVWNRRLRPWVLGLGVAFHLAIDYAIRVGFFSYAIFVLYIAFVPPHAMERWLQGMRSRLRERRQRRLAEPAEPVPSTVEASASGTA
ncbi:MAG TPA: HTTM domain-containing protein [Acidimicrobiales bacterium]|nr:HTTM domain-containing protein [Acidimicrobiales bacterium]